MHSESVFVTVTVVVAGLPSFCSNISSVSCATFPTQVILTSDLSTKRRKMNESYGDGHPGVAETTCIIGCALGNVSLDKLKQQGAPSGLRGKSRHPPLCLGVTFLQVVSSAWWELDKCLLS